jgi:two-component system, probable response regulator PhcQ
MPHTVLLVDDEPHVTQALKRALHKEPYVILSAASADEALAIMACEPVDVVISDELMPGMLGSQFLALVYRQYPDTVSIMLTGHANLEAALRAINEGHVYRFLTKPCNELELRVTLRQAIQQKQLATESRRLLKKVKRQHSVLQELEREHPGISKLDRDGTGTIVIDDADYDVDILIQQIHAELDDSERMVPTGKGEE